MWDLWAMLMAGGSFWCICMLYLRYNFVQINLEIRSNIKQNNIDKVIQLTHYHKKIEMETYWLNSELKYHYYILYKLMKPLVNLFLFMTHARDMTTLMRFGAALAVISAWFFKFWISYLGSSVMTAAHRPQSGLYSNILSRNSKMSIEKKLKVLQFIERLSGPGIGFHCYDLFPINTFNFADYALDTMASYCLIINLLRDNGFV